ncbi:hypothetical protein BRC93_11300 [Halobacteriales archaeon QS_5_70_15]|nr:MAG: hypothetical protein BRC93_11300 [Halobacteriales archaeon QS_5_70_15]
MSTGVARGFGLRPRLPDRRVWVGVLAVEALWIAIHFALSPASVTDPRYVLYPFVWINAGLYAVWRVRPEPAGDGLRRLADLVGAGYFLALAWLSGLLAVYGPDHAHDHLHGWQVTLATPGWGPRIAYVGSWFHAYFVPYRVVGYLALAYLLAAAVREFSARTLTGALGVATCIGCSFPLLLSLAGGAGLGAGAGLATFSGLSLDLSTAAFLLAVGVLVWGSDGERGGD